MIIKQDESPLQDNRIENADSAKFRSASILLQFFGGGLWVKCGVIADQTQICNDLGRVHPIL